MPVTDVYVACSHSNVKEFSQIFVQHSPYGAYSVTHRISNQNSPSPVGAKLLMADIQVRIGHNLASDQVYWLALAGGHISTVRTSAGPTSSKSLFTTGDCEDGRNSKKGLDEEGGLQRFRKHSVPQREPG